MSDQPTQYAVVVPVKPPALGKSRLVGLSDEHRRQLAAAFALDTVTACLGASCVGSVLVATDDASFSEELSALGCAAIPDGVTSDLNGALRQAAAEANRRWPDLVPVALCADLPALRSQDLDLALTSVDTVGRWFVADAAGIGTTLYTAPPDEFDPRFGVSSRIAHLDTGAFEIAGELTSLRHDVDNLDDLRRAMRLGVGPRTAVLLAGLGIES